MSPLPSLDRFDPLTAGLLVRYNRKFIKGISQIKKEMAALGQNQDGHLFLLFGLFDSITS